MRPDVSVSTPGSSGFIVSSFKKARFLVVLGTLLTFVFPALQAAVQDTTPPVFAGAVRDGSLSWDDLQFSFAPDELTANWNAATDPGSGVAEYFYAIGTTPGGSDFAGWASNGTSTKIEYSKRSPEPDTLYYVSVYAVNGAGLKSPVKTSKGQSVKTLPYRNGIKLPDENERQFIAARTVVVKTVQPNSSAAKRFAMAPGAAGLPARAKNFQYLPSVGSQGIQGSCAAFAVCYYMKTYQEAKEHGWGRSDPRSNPERVYSPAFGYNLCNSGYDAGSWPQSIMARVVEHGCATWKDMPYDQRDCTSWPSETAWRNAIPYRAADVGSIDITTDDGIGALKQHLANGNIGVVTMAAYDNFMRYPVDCAGINNGVLFSKTNRVLFGHAMAVIGYDDEKTFYDGETTRKGAFLAVNSWGGSWGVYDADAGSRGFVWIAYDYVKTYAGFTTAAIMTDRQGYSTTAYGIFSVRHSQRYNLNIRFLHGDSPETADASRACTEWYFPGNNNDLETEQKIVVDLNGFPRDEKPYFLEVYDDSLGNASVGQITDAAIEIDGRVWAASTVPVSTVNGQNTYVAIQTAGNLAGLTAELRVTYPSQSQDVRGSALQYGNSYAQDLPCLGKGSFDVLLTLSGDPGAKPSLEYRLAQGTIVRVPLEGSGKTWHGRFMVEPSAGEGEAYFILEAINSSGVGGATITKGGRFYVKAVASAQYNGVAQTICYPNPARMSKGDILKIGHIADSAEDVTIQIYTIAGELVRTLRESDGITASSGEKTGIWDGRNSNGERTASGVYLCLVKGPAGKKIAKAAVIW